jgi:hypothetical protein
MKACPTCNRTFEDTFTFCLIDGSVLSAPFDPTVPKPFESPAPDAGPPPTEVFNPAAGLDSLPPTRDAAPGELQPTIAAPFVQQPMHQPSPRFAPTPIAEERSLPDVVRWMFIVRGLLAVLFGLLLLLWGMR